MLNIPVTDEEIEAAERLSGQGEFVAALTLAQEMLNRARDDETRMRLLFNVVGCSTRLNLTDVTNEAVRALEHLPDSKVSRAFANLLQAMSYIEFGKAQEALNLIDANLKLDLMDREDFQDSKYEHLVHKGRALTRLARCDDALSSFDSAHMMCPNGKYEANILIDRSNCLMALRRYDEAYDAASAVLSFRDDDLATLAMQYMAECRMWQSRVQESLALYRDLLKRLPCRLVQENHIQAGIKNGMTYLEKLHPLGRPV